MADEAVSNLNGLQVSVGKNGIIYDLVKVIGTHKDGTLTSKVKIYFNSSCEITTMYPIK